MKTQFGGKRLLFITGTRADFGKLRPLVEASREVEGWTSIAFVTGMHMQKHYGLTINEVVSTGISNFPFVNFAHGDSMAQTLSKTIAGLSDYLSAFPVDFILIHGDRVEALAGAIVGSLMNIRVIHVEGGELSGTVDDSIRHAITKFSHVHLVSNEDARLRVLSLGEDPESVHAIGSPELDVMKSGKLPNLKEVRRRYGLASSPTAIFLMHPVTTQDPSILGSCADQILTELTQRTNLQVVVIRPNNDFGSTEIDRAIDRYQECQNVRVIPSMRFEHYISLLKSAAFIVGNSSSGVREAPFFGTPAINIGTRQDRRSTSPSIINLGEHQVAQLPEILIEIQSRRTGGESLFGDGLAGQRFVELLKSGILERLPIQKSFHHNEV
jgi:UDP-N-acetylglucosamine 2-epimerase (hydrolysing)